MQTPHTKNSASALARRRRRGASIVETAIVLNICLVFALGLYDFCRVIMIQQLVTNAAREGARLAIVSTTTLATTDIQTTVTNYLVGQQINNLTISVYEADSTTGANIGTWTNASLSNCIGVSVSGTIKTMTPTFSLLPSSVPVSAVCVMNSEAN